MHPWAKSKSKRTKALLIAHWGKVRVSDSLGRLLGESLTVS